MKRIGWLISTYLLRVIIPYFAISWSLLSVVLFVQQAGRYADIFFNVNVPTSLVWQLAIALIPNVIAFTCPMAVLVGTIIGLAKMQGDSELVAIRASGVGNFQIAVPIMILGAILSLFALFVNAKGVPFAASLVRSVALQAAIKKLESPLEPGVFTSDIPGYMIYVREGDVESGQWTDIFIYSEDRATDSVRLITAKAGRVNTTDQNSELVLENATVSTIPNAAAQNKYISEKLGEVRFSIRTKRSELIEKMNSTVLNQEELGLQELSAFAATREGRERVEAEILWQRRMLLSVTPFIFCLLGTVIILRYNRGGRGFGVTLALNVLIGFYLLAFFGEQLARVNLIGVFVSSLFPILGSVLVIVWFSLGRKFDFFGRLGDALRNTISNLRKAPAKLQVRDIFVDLTAGLRDFDISRNLLKNSLLTLSFLITIFIIFTAFEMWRFAGTFDGGVYLLGRYLFFLLPHVYLQLAPPAAMIGILATYVIKSRQNELVVWTSTGQSVYRLLLPCFVLIFSLGIVNWVIQETVVPRANQLQEEARSLLRTKGIAEVQPGKLWVANGRSIYSFNCASDNEKRGVPCGEGSARDVAIYELAPNDHALQSVYRSESAVWERGIVRLGGKVEEWRPSEASPERETDSNRELFAAFNPFMDLRTKPTQLNSSQLRGRVAATTSELDKRNLSVALEKKWVVLVMPLVLALFSAPFAVSLGRNSKTLTVGYAIGIWLLYTAFSTIFEQLGLNGFIAPVLAVWAPVLIFSMLGIYFLSRIRT